MSVWKIPLSDIDFTAKEEKAVRDVIRSRWLSMGKRTQQFEREMCDYLGCQYALAMSNCTAALHTALVSIGITQGDEVIVPSLTFVATANVVLHCGAKPIFADISSLANPTISPEDIERKITKKTRAIIVVHYAGYPCLMNRIEKIARKHNLEIVEDTAHAIGATYNRKSLGTLGIAGCLSFFSNKNLVTGEGGMLITNSKQVYETAKLIRCHGMTSLTWQRHNEKVFQPYDVVSMGYNYRPTEIVAAIGIEQLKRLDTINAKRKAIVEHYIRLLGKIYDINIPFEGFKGNSAYHIFPILAPDQKVRQALIKGLNNAGVQTSYHYHPIHKFTFYESLPGSRKVSLPITEEYSRREITLPLYQSMTKSDVVLIANEIKKVMC